MLVEWFVLVLKELELVKVVFQAKQMVDFLVESSPRIFTVSKFFGCCNSHITVLLLIVKSAFGTACIHLFFPPYHLANDTLVSFHSYL